MLWVTSGRRECGGQCRCQIAAPVALLSTALRAGIEAVPAVTLEAASSLAFSSRQLLWNVQLPLAVRFALPSLINNLIDLVKMTAVASAIAVGDITYAAIMIWTQSDNVLELMILMLILPLLYT